MLRIAICESNQQHLNSIKQGIITALFSECEFVIDTYLSAKSFTENQDKMKEYDVVFLNPRLKDETGLFVAAKFRNVNISSSLIVIAEDDSYVLDAYKYNAFDYLIKPISLSLLDDTLRRVFYYQFPDNKCYMIKSGTGVEKIKLNMIKYFSSSGRVVTLNLKNSTRNFYAKLDDVEASIADNVFIRIHKSYLVNSKYIERIEGLDVILSDGTILPVSRERNKTVKEKLLNI